MREAEPVSEYVMRCCNRSELSPDGLGAQVYEAADAGKITDHEALLIVRSYLGAGLDSTVDTIGNMLNCFASYPAEWEKLGRDPSRVRGAIEEAVRFDSPIQGLLRTTVHEVEISGITVGADQKILVSPGTGNRDPRKWEDPDTLDIDRDAAGHLGFGYGIHECVGQVIARLEVEALFTEMARRVARIEPCGPAPRRLNNTLRGFERLPLILHAA